jgi:hypothetical protein
MRIEDEVEGRVVSPRRPRMRKSAGRQRAAEARSEFHQHFARHRTYAMRSNE